MTTIYLASHQPVPDTSFNADLDFYIYGCDNFATHESTNPIPWIEAGTRLQGVLAIKLHYAHIYDHILTQQVKFQEQYKQPAPPVKVNADIRIDSEYSLHIIVPEFDLPDAHYKEPFTFQSYVFKYCFDGLAGPQARYFSPRQERNYLWVPFWLDIPTQICQSTTPAFKLVSQSNELYIRNSLRVKIDIPFLGVKSLTKARDVLILRSRPYLNPNNPPISKSVDVDNLKLRIVPVSTAFMEGDVAQFTMFIEADNVSSRIPLLGGWGITDGSITLIGTYESRAYVLRGYYDVGIVALVRRDQELTFLSGANAQPQTVEHKLGDVDLRGLKILSGFQGARTFGIDIPRTIEFPTLLVNQGLHHISMQYHLQLELKRPGLSSNLKIRIPIDIYPNPSGTARVMLHSLLPPPNPPLNLPRTYAGVFKKTFLIRIRAVRNLPTMDLLLGKADTFATILLNELHFRNTKVIKNSLNPEWNQLFTIYMDDCEYNTDISVMVECYHNDIAKRDTLIGSAQFVMSKSAPETSFHEFSSTVTPAAATAAAAGGAMGTTAAASSSGPFPSVDDRYARIPFETKEVVMVKSVKKAGKGDTVVVIDYAWV